MKTLCTLQFAVEYDDAQADAESVAEALEQLLDAALAASKGQLAACGTVELGELLVAVDGAGIC